MSVFHSIVKDRLLVRGWIALAVSLIVYLIPEFLQHDEQGHFGLFLFNFAISVIYLFSGKMGSADPVDEHRVHYRMIKLLLFLISAYALNRIMEVFAASPLWLTVLLLVAGINYVISAFFPLFPSWARYAVFFIYGVALALFLYFSIYLVPLYLFSAFALIILGFSIHSFVPLLITIATIRLAAGLAKHHPRYLLGMGAGLLTAFGICAIFVLSWNDSVVKINQAYTEALAKGDNKLPAWIQVAQKIDNDYITEKILKEDLVYKVSGWESNFFWDTPRRNFGTEPLVHDPLIMMAHKFSGEVDINKDDRIKILESQYNERHEALERLWSGDLLKTNLVNTNIRVWPGLHLAYTEKILTVYNNQVKHLWRGQQEAIYTLHLPEGGVITALSLWINGKEEKGILTSMGKADKAYKTIVGVESRDPSLVHWQEGNTVSIRVFPVMPGETRTFKIGITAPLRKNKEGLVYDNIWFEGPDASSAKEQVNLEMVNTPSSFIQQASFQSNNENIFTVSRNYLPVWSLHFKDPGTTDQVYSFNGNSYSLIPYVPQRFDARITDVYLDINRMWSDEELSSVWETVKEKNVWVYDGEMQLVNANNKEALFSTQRKNQFSLFPFHLLKNRSHGLVIGKSGNYSPNISDLEGSSFLINLRQQGVQGEKIRLFHLGNEFSPYIRSLKEFRLFDFECGDTDLLKQLIKTGQFMKDPESDQLVLVHSAGLAILKSPGKSVSTAPDHLMRLFAYNHIMKQLGSAGLTRTETDSSQLVTEAQEAYVVSPVSSLVVLETKQDYERFGIKDDVNGLKNASLSNKGAVPEPAEWAIIIMTAGFFIFFLIKFKTA